MNITKDYIELCKNPKVQGLKKYYYRGDWYFNTDSKKPDIIPYPCSKIGYIWLPTGDQLDQCIVDICEKQSIDYIFKYLFSEMGFEAYVTGGVTIKEGNPLICKIKLLISLLKEG